LEEGAVLKYKRGKEKIIHLVLLSRSLDHAV
jgi:hypothetical protein